MDDQAQAIDFLASGAGRGVPARNVARIDTHASSVFLVGERALKLKRAVRFSYLDYSTLALREAACRAEYEINRRIAPQLYLGVLAIRRRADGTVGFDGAGETLDWVVEMRRFDGETLFARLAEQRRLTAELMRELADVIAAFHAAAARAENGGGRDAMARVIDGNRDNLRAAGTVLDQDCVTRVDAAARAALGAGADLIERRREHGKVRRCHGDLHLGNICLHDGRPVLFDAIEFSADLTAIDVLYDFAFLVMDLSHRSLGALANLVLNRYLDLRHDDEGMGLMPLFLSLRAAIRAHVTAAAAAQHSGDAALQDEARRYLALAETVLAPGEPRVVAIGGRSGSGKSTLAQAVAPDLGAVPGARVLRSDVLRKAILDLPPEQKLPPSAYSHAMTRQVYARMQHDAARILGAGYSVVLDATFLDPAERAAAEQVAANAGVPFAGLWLEARRDVMAIRLARRKRDASDATLDVLDRQLASDTGAMGWKKIESGGSLARVTATARRALGIVTPPALTGRANSPRMAGQGTREGSQ